VGGFTATETIRSLPLDGHENEDFCCCKAKRTYPVHENRYIIYRAYALHASAGSRAHHSSRRHSGLMIRTYIGST